MEGEIQKMGFVTWTEAVNAARNSRMEETTKWDCSPGRELGISSSSREGGIHIV